MADATPAPVAPAAKRSPLKWAGVRAMQPSPDTIALIDAIRAEPDAAAMEVIELRDIAEVMPPPGAIPVGDMRALAMAFHSTRADAEKWMKGPQDVDAFFTNSYAGDMSSGHRWTVLFLHEVWNGGEGFDTKGLRPKKWKFSLWDAIANWDPAHRAAFGRWASRPWVC